MMAVISLYSGQLESFLLFLLLFGLCATYKIMPNYLKNRPKKIIPPEDQLIVDYTPRKNSKVFRMGQLFIKIPGLTKLFQYELRAVEQRIPLTGKVIDAKRYVVQSGVATLMFLIIASVLIPIIAILTNIPYLLPLMAVPLLLPLTGGLLLSGTVNDRKSGVDAEFLAFLTYAVIMHTVQKTMFWTMQSICNYKMFKQLGNDSKIVIRYAKGGGEEEGNSITRMARYHPNKKFREFLEKYVSYIPTNPSRLENHVESARSEALKSTVEKVEGYANSTNMIFFMGTMMISILPIMFTVIAFLPDTGVDGGSVIWIMFILPLIFIIFPLMLSPGTVFMQGKINPSKKSAIIGAACFGALFLIFPEHWLISASVSVTLLAGINYSANSKINSNAMTTDRELPDMLDYIAEQKKGKPNLMEIFVDYSILPNTPEVLRNILQSISSDIMIKRSDKAFLDREFPSNTSRFVFFILHAIHEHGGGTYSTIISMSYSIRQIVTMNNSFVSSSKFSIAIVVISPVIFMFCVMMTSFISFGVPESEDIAIDINVMQIKASDVANIVDELQPVVLIIGIAGGLGVSKIVRYTFFNTQYLFVATVISTICILSWDLLFGTLQGIV